MGLHSMTVGGVRKLIACVNREEGFRNSCCEDEEGPFCLYIQNYDSGYYEEEPADGRWGYDDPSCIPVIIAYKKSSSQILNLWANGYNQDRFPEFFTIPPSLEHLDNQWILVSGPSTCYWVKWKEPGGEVCKVVIQYEPMDEECGDCKFRVGSSELSDYSWEEVGRTSTIINRLDIDLEDPAQASGWHLGCPQLSFIAYSECIPPDTSHCEGGSAPEWDCSRYEETYIYDEGGANEAIYYVYYDIRDPSQDFHIPGSAVITQECVDNHLAGNPTQKALTRWYSFVERQPWYHLSDDYVANEPASITTVSSGNYIDWSVAAVRTRHREQPWSVPAWSRAAWDSDTAYYCAKLVYKGYLEGTVDSSISVRYSCTDNRWLGQTTSGGNVSTAEGCWGGTIISCSASFYYFIRNHWTISNI